MSASVARAESSSGHEFRAQLNDRVEAERVGVSEALARTTLLTQREKARLAIIIVREARSHRLDPLLVTSVIQVESGFDPLAVSNRGALGLMQLMPSTARWLAARAHLSQPGSLFDLERNVHLGCFYLAYLIRRFGSEQRGLVAYHMGPAAAQRALVGQHGYVLLAGYPAWVQQVRERLSLPLTKPTHVRMLASFSWPEGNEETAP
jgi:soluble lytic murein transglycosylase-like protein